MIIASEKVTTEEVKEWRGLHLLHFQGSTCSLKVRLILEELGVDWQSHPVNLIRHQNHSPWFLGINPRGVVPVLVHDGEVHVESNDIIKYLDETFAAPGESLFFAQESAEAEQARELLWLEDSLHTELRLLTIVFGPLALKKESDIRAQEDNGSFDAKRDHEVRWWRDKLENGIDESEIRAALGGFREAFERLDKQLQSQRFLMGESLSIVDISWFVNLQRLVRLGYPLSEHRHLSTFYKRLCSRPAFRAEDARLSARVNGTIFGFVRLLNGLRGKDLPRYL